MNRREHLTWLGVLGGLFGVGCSSSEPNGYGYGFYGYGYGRGYGYGYGFANGLGPAHYKNLTPQRVVAVKKDA